MNRLFFEILQNSLKVSVLFLLLTGLKLIFRKKLSPTVHYRLWMIFFVSLLGLPSLLPKFSAVSRIVSEQPVGKVYTMTVNNLGLITETPAPSEPSNVSEPTASSTSNKPFQPVPMLWISGVILGLFTLVFSYVRTAWRLRSAVLRKGETVCFLTSEFDSPFLYGLFFPKIIVPTRLEAEPERLDFVLRHESIHRRRKDNFMLLFSAVGVCFYWFLPFVWLAFFRMKNDMERSVDFELSKNLSDAEKAAYADSILQCVKERKLLMLQSSFSKDQSKNRILSILSDTKFRRGFGAVVVAAVLLTVAGSLFLKPHVETKAELSADIYFPYTKMKELSTPYLGNASAVGKIVDSLPKIEPFLKYRGMELKTTEEPYRLVLKYEETVLPEQKENPLRGAPYFHTKKFNNALLLLMMIDNLSHVDFEISVPPEYRYEGQSETEVYTISREEAEKAVGGIQPVKNDSSLYYTTLDYNNAVYSYNIRHVRMQLGSPEEWLLLQWGEPIEKISAPGETEPIEYRYKEENGQSVSVRLAHDNATSERHIAELSIRAEGGVSGGEMLEGIGLYPEEGKVLNRKRVVEHLGNPRMQFESTEYYRLSSGLSDYLYFVYNGDGEVLEYGIVRRNLYML